MGSNPTSSATTSFAPKALVRGYTTATSSNSPDEVAALAGTEWVLERTEQTHTLNHTGLGSQRAVNRYVVHPDDIRRIHQGEAFIIHGGQAVELRIRTFLSP